MRLVLQARHILVDPVNIAAGHKVPFWISLGARQAWIVRKQLPEAWIIQTGRQITVTQRIVCLTRKRILPGGLIAEPAAGFVVPQVHPVFVRIIWMGRPNLGLIPELTCNPLLP